MTSTPTPTLERAATGTDFRALLARLSAGPLAGEPAWRAELRRAALAAYERLGLPTRRHEDWRYANLTPLARGSFDVVPELPAGLDRATLRAAFLGGDDAPRLVLVDGHLDPELSRLDGPGSLEGTVLCELGAALDGDPELRARMGSLAPSDQDGLVALSSAFQRDGALVRVPRGAALEQPLQIVHVSGASRPDALVAPRTLIVLEEESRASVVETFLGPDSARALTLGVAELFVGPGAALEHHRLHAGGRGSTGEGGSMRIAAVHARLERDASLVSGVYAFGGSLARDGLRIELAGEGAECTLRGLYTAGGERHADCDLLVDHQVPHCTSRQEYRGVLDGRGRGTFHGRVIVRPDAQKSEARQSNRNLLLSREARADTRPQLEIFADDVQCSHGATIGQLDADAVFYLRTRGLDPEFARELLTRAFASEVVQEIGWPPLRERVERELDLFLRPSASITASSAAGSAR